MKTIVFLILAGMLFSCKNTPKQEIVEKQQPTKELTKLEQLYLLPKDSIYEFYDLSNDSIKKLPDLSEYAIKKLDLSYNQIDSLIQDRLPKNIEHLNLSNNLFKGRFFLDDFSKTLKYMNLSGNKISDYNANAFLIRLILSNNELKSVAFGNKKMNFLDLSNNPKLSNEVFFDPK
ncbi:MAG: hypothetical protein Q4B43_10150 [Bacteroidota bacterium]|nr:hypothetical protein [Bacteroidota bacterium]